MCQATIGAFACGRGIEAGLEWLALFKSLVGPIVFEVESTRE